MSDYRIGGASDRSQTTEFVEAHLTKPCAACGAVRGNGVAVPLRV